MVSKNPAPVEMATHVTPFHRVLAPSQGRDVCFWECVRFGFCLIEPKYFGIMSFHLFFPQHTVDRRNPANHLGCINLVNNGINYLSTGAGFLPSTVCAAYMLSSDHALSY